MNRGDIEDIVESILDERGTSGATFDEDEPKEVIPIKPFAAFGDMGNPVEVVGIGYIRGMTQFLVVEEDEGAIFPIFRENVFKSRESAQRAAMENGATQ
jgi:hypothetical protein